MPSHGVMTPWDVAFWRLLPIYIQRTYTDFVKTFKRANKTLDDVSAASVRVIQTTEWATVALMGVAAVSLVALLCACVALGKVSDA